MLERLKQYPLVGLALAVAGGLVLAHVVNEIGDNLYENDPDFLTDSAIVVIVAAVLALIVWKRRSIRTWLGRHKNGIVIGVFSAWVLCFALMAIRVSTEKKAETTPVTFDLNNAIPIK